MKDYEFVSEAYLYSPWNGKIKVYKGEVWHREESRDWYTIYYESTHFRMLDKHGKIMKRFQCSPTEGEVHNKVVWLSEPDMNKAAQILIEYEELQIAKLEEKIENHKQLIEIYKDQVT